MTNEDVVKAASEKLLFHDDWRKAYERYAEFIKKYKKQDKNVASFLKKILPRDLGPVRIYSSINLAQKSSAEYDLRIFGQSVGALVIKKIKDDYKLFLKIKKEHEVNNHKHLKIETKANPPRKPYGWETEEATNIFNSFISYKGNGAEMHSEEHKLETLVLSDLAKEHKENGKKGKKKLTYIRPVVLGGLGFFQMRTPFKASKHSDKDYPKYSMRNDGAASGGGIDILERFQHKNCTWRLAVIELKDENNKRESQPVVMQQALVYATFIAHLLRDKNCGISWWNLFRNQDNDANEPEKIEIDVVTMMPPIPLDKKGNPIYKECDMKPIPVPNIPNVTLFPSTIYVESNKSKDIITNVFGTLINDKRGV